LFEISLPMKKLIFPKAALFLLIYSSASYGQDTFSICAVELATGQVGSAGATCITSATTSVTIISDVHPGVGVIHTQAYWLPANQNYAKSLMNLGTLSPQQIIDSLVAHDAQNNPAIRQYGIVDINGGVGRHAAYTGVNTNDYKNHIHKDTLGYAYSIQGNILLGQQILDSMESKFLNTSGSLACKLMAALQGAKVVGADTRCLSYNTSSFSAVLRVANPSDPQAGPYYLNLTVNTYPPNAPPYMEPIDSMQTLFDAWGGCAAAYIPSNSTKSGIKIFPNPVKDKFTVSGFQFSINEIEILNAVGKVVRHVKADGEKETVVEFTDAPPGIYLLRVRNSQGEEAVTRLIKE
jgi:uncharacterized Ntn-hydrolase superfamily protein